jgi:hypothetical protein
MAYTTGQTAAQLTAALVSAGMAQDAAANAVATLGWATNVPGATPATVIWGVLCKCTTSSSAGVPAVYAYDATPT